MVNSGSNFTFATKANGQVIEVSHFTEHETALNALATEFNTAVTKKLTLFTPTTASASLNLPGGVNPTTPASGDFWHVASTGELKLQTVNGTKTVAFTDSTFSTLSVTSLALGSTSITGTAASLAGTLAVTGATTLGATTVQSSSTSAVLVRSGSTTDTNLASINGTAKTFNLLNGTDVQVFSDNAATAAKLTIDGATGNLSIPSGDASIGGALTVTGNIGSSGNITSGTSGTVTAGTGGFVTGGSKYASPSLLNTGGFTIVIGNGTDAITSSVVDIPAVIMPYACTVTSIRAYDTSDATSTINLRIEKSTWPTTTTSFSTVGTVSLSNDRAATGSITTAALAQNDIVRVRIASGTPTTKQIAVHVRVVRS